MLKFDAQGLVPVVIVDDASNEVLMVASMSEESLRLTRENGQTYFFSRSRNKIWHKGEQSGNFQDVRDIFVNCEENSLLIRVFQHGEAACHEGYHSCYHRRLLPDDQYELVAKRIFDPEDVYQDVQSEANLTTDDDKYEVQTPQQLEISLRQLYAIYTSLRDQDKTAHSNTSRLLHEKNREFLLKRLSNELDELVGVQTGAHIHTDLPADTALEGSQVGYWLFLVAVASGVEYDQINPHAALLKGFTGKYTLEHVAELCLRTVELASSQDSTQLVHGLIMGFDIIGWACASAGISPLAPTEYDLAQMRQKGLID
jgi:phosphoribosyl-AMP cyclohydrolase